MTALEELIVELSKLNCNVENNQVLGPNNQKLKVRLVNFEDILHDLNALHNMDARKELIEVFLEQVKIELALGAK